VARLTVEQKATMRYPATAAGPNAGSRRAAPAIVWIQHGNSSDRLVLGYNYLPITSRRTAYRDELNISRRDGTPAVARAKIPTHIQSASQLNTGRAGSPAASNMGKHRPSRATRAGRSGYEAAQIKHGRVLGWNKSRRASRWRRPTSTTTACREFRLRAVRVDAATWPGGGLASRPAHVLRK